MKSVTFTNTIQEDLVRYIKKNNPTKIAVLVDENTKKLCLPLLNIHDSLVIEIPSGEENKGMETCSKIWQELTDSKFDRKGLLINLGGGVIGDMGGFCARTYKRGISFINIPTTLLSQVDASVGGKLGIDFKGFKNHIGLFSDPDHVFIDTVFLGTLSHRELRSGYAEVIKHHLIRDCDGWMELRKKNWEKSDWPKVVRHSVQIKSDIVKKDPLEEGPRKSLNFGHTIGHAIESYHLNCENKYLHGEAIAMGMICESHLSYQKGMINELELHSITAGIRSVFDIKSIEKTIYHDLIQLMQHDKKNKSGEILYALLDGIGKTKCDVKVTTKEVTNALNYLN